MTRKIGIASDHAGVDLKSSILAHLGANGVELSDFGPTTTSAVDYPDYAQVVAQALKNGEIDLGILICGTGVGMSIAANRYIGVRAAVVTSPPIAALARQHNNANILCLSARFVDVSTNLAIVDKFLSAEFAGGHHQQRVNKLDMIADN